MSYERPLLSTISTLLSRSTPVIHALIGPRQVGKTTIARQIQETIGFPSIYATADSPVPLDSVWIETHWRRAVAAIRVRSLLSMMRRPGNATLQTP